MLISRKASFVEVVVSTMIISGGSRISTKKKKLGASLDEYIPVRVLTSLILKEARFSKGGGNSS